MAGIPEFRDYHILDVIAICNLQQLSIWSFFEFMSAKAVASITTVGRQFWVLFLNNQAGLRPLMSLSLARADGGMDLVNLL